MPIPQYAARKLPLAAGKAARWAGPPPGIEIPQVGSPRECLSSEVFSNADDENIVVTLQI